MPWIEKIAARVCPNMSEDARFFKNRLRRLPEISQNLPLLKNRLSCALRLRSGQASQLTQSQLNKRSQNAGSRSIPRHLHRDRRRGARQGREHAEVDGRQAFAAGAFGQLGAAVEL